MKRATGKVMYRGVEHKIESTWEYVGGRGYQAFTDLVPEKGERIPLTPELEREIEATNAKCVDLHQRIERLDRETRHKVMLASLGYVPKHFSALASSELARLDRAVLDAEKREYEPA